MGRHSRSAAIERQVSETGSRAVEKAAETLANPALLTALPRLRAPDGKTTFVELLEDFGSTLVERIADAYREFWLWPHPGVLMNSRNG